MAHQNREHSQFSNALVVWFLLIVRNLSSVIASVKVSMSSSSELSKKPFRYYFSRDKKNVALGMLCLFGTNFLDSIAPIFIGRAIDQMVEGVEIKTLGQTLLMLASVVAGLSLFRYFWRIFWGGFHHKVAEHLRNQIFDRLTHLGPSFFQKKTIGELMSLINNDVNSFRMAIGPGVLILFDAIFLLLIIPPIMLQISVDWTLKTLVLMPLVPFVVYKLLTIIHNRYKTQQDQFADMSGVTQEIIAGARVIKSFAQETNQLRLFNFSSRNYEAACNGVSRPDALFHPALEIAVFIGSVILLIIGAPEVMSGKVSIGDFFIFYQYIQRMAWPMTAIGIGLNFIQKGKASFSRIAEVLETEADVQNTGTVKLKDFEKLEFKNLDFTHPGNDIPSLKNISFSLEKGEVLGVIGTIGSGKTSIIDLISRFYPYENNKVFVNDVPVEKIELNSLRNLLAVVPQVPFLFSRRISENVAYGLSEVDLAEVKSMTAMVNIEKEIEALPDAYQAYIGEKGVNLSGGQKQRLTLARALIRKAPLLILDDSLSAVDTKTERTILDIIKTGQRDKTKSAILVSNRVSSVQWANKILVLKDGQIEAQGVHDDLLKESPTYKSLYDLQTRGGTTYESSLLQ